MLALSQKLWLIMPSFIKLFDSKKLDQAKFIDEIKNNCNKNGYVTFN